jgi:Flp pilus assembly protein TadG
MNVRRRSGSRRGSALAEMAVVTPLLLLVLIGLVDAGQAGELAIVVANAARAGAQYGVVTATNVSGMQTAATNDANTSHVTAVATTYCQCANANGTPGAVSASCTASNCSSTHQIVYVQVVTTGTMPSLFNYAPLPASLRSISLTAKVVMRVPQ